MPSAAARRLIRVAAPAALLVVAIIATLIALHIGGGAKQQPLSDPGAVVRYGLPIAKLLVNLGAAVAIGALTLAAVAIARESTEYGAAMDVAAGACAVWTIAAASTVFLSFLAAYQQPVSLDPSFGDLIATYLQYTENGRAWFATVVIAAVLTVMSFAVRNQGLVLAMAIGAVLALIPMALQGHAGDEADHDAAISAIWIHVAASGLWLGGLTTVALLSRAIDGARLGDLVARYSTLAMWCFIAVAASGYVSAEIRVGTFENLLTPYGALVLVKIGALTALGLFGLAYRRFFIARLSADAERRRWFWLLVVAELAFMGIAAGTAAALARTATPLSAIPVYGDSPAEQLTGAPLPPPVTLELLATSWSFDLLWVLVCGFGAFFYIAAVVRLRRRGDSWPVLRTVLWLLGLTVLFYVTTTTGPARRSSSPSCLPRCPLLRPCRR